MIRRTVEFSTPGTRLSVAHRQLVIERPDHPRTTLPIEDLGVVIVDDARASYTQAVFIELLAAGATVMATGRDHLPLGLMLPIDAHHVQTERHRAQVEAGAPRRKRIWQALIRAKIERQADVLAALATADPGLAAMARRVRSGDPDNLEAQAAQRYWPRLFGRAFRRDRAAEGVNALLNYGYAVIRAATARAVVAAGLIPSLGVFHKNRGNPFCLADDLFEPWRPLVDARVRAMTPGEGDPPDISARETRAQLLALLGETVRIGGKRAPVQVALSLSATSLARALTGDDPTLALPESLALAPMTEGEDDGCA